MDVAALEDDLVAVLRVAIPDEKVEIVHLPENMADFKRSPVGGARIVVGFNESNFKDQLTTQPVSQPDEITLVISMQARTLRDENYGVYPLKKKIEDALVGYTPDNCDMPIYGVYFGPPGPGMDVLNEDGWCFVFHIKTRSVLVQKIEITDTNFAPVYREPLLKIN